MSKRLQFRECASSRRSSKLPQLALAARLPAFIGCGVDTENAFSHLRVALVGVGSVGMRIAEHLARLRVAELWLVDPRKCCKPESVLTHPISRVTALPKATYTARLCKRISPATRVFFHVGQIQDLWLDTFADTHLCVMATDNLAAELEFGQRCLWLGKRLVQAALHGESLTVQIRVFANATGAGPCPACGFGAAEWRQLFDQVQYSCEGGTISQPALSISGPPTRSPGHLCSLAADLALNQIMRLVLRLGEEVGDTIQEYCGFNNRLVTSRLDPNSACRCDHTPFTVTYSPVPLRGYSFERLVKEFAASSRNESPTLTVGGLEWVDCGLCHCVEPAVVQRFLPAGQFLAGRCARCHAAIQTQLFFRHRAVSAATLGKSVGTPLCLLGVRRTPWVLLRHSDRAVLVQDPFRTLPLP